MTLFSSRHNHNNHNNNLTKKGNCRQPRKQNFGMQPYSNPTGWNIKLAKGPPSPHLIPPCRLTLEREKGQCLEPYVIIHHLLSYNLFPSAPSFTPHNSLSILRPPSFTLHPSPSILHPPSFTLHPSPSILPPPSSTLHPSPFILHP